MKRFEDWGTESVTLGQQESRLSDIYTVPANGSCYVCRPLLSAGWST